jgi:hypothetical protein
MLNHLPDDILGHIFTYLNAEERITTNEVVKHRVVRKFPHAYAETHHLRTMARKWKAMIFSIEQVWQEEFKEKRLLRIYRLIQDIRKPVNLLVAIMRRDFAITLVSKMHEFVNDPQSTPLHKMIKRIAQKC